MTRSGHRRGLPISLLRSLRCSEVWGDPSATRVHCSPWRCGGCLAVRGPCAAVIGRTAYRTDGQSAFAASSEISAEIAATRLRRGKESHHRIPLRRGAGARFNSFAAELVAMPVEVLVVWGTPAAFAAKRATTSIPILIGAAGDVVNTGLI